MKILNIANRVPFPLKDGGAVALHRQLKCMAEAGAEIHLISVISERDHMGVQEIRASLGNLCRFDGYSLQLKPGVLGAIMALIRGKSYNISRFDHPGMRKLIEVTLKNESFDLVQFESIFMAPYLDIAQKHGIPAVLRQHNAEFQIWERRAAIEKNPLKRWYLHVLAQQLKQYESMMLSEFDAVISITEQDQETFRKLGCNKPMMVYEAGIEIPHQLPDIRSELRYKLYHLGSMEWEPNREGLEWFIQHCWPLIHKKHPETELHIAGKGLEDSFIQGAVPYSNHGEVPSAVEFISEMGVCIVPIRSGSGIRIKILEAILAGKVVISTSTGIQGLRLEQGKHFLQADTPEHFLYAVTEITDPIKFHQLANHAREQIIQHYNAQHLATELMSFYQDLLKRNALSAGQ